MASRPCSSPSAAAEQHRPERRSVQRVRRRPRCGAGVVDRPGDRHQVDGSGRHRRRDRRHHALHCAGASVPCRVEPRIPPRGQRDRRFHGARPIFIGVEDDRARDVLERAYAPLTARGAPLLSTSRRAAELVKYASNCFLATKISFINEVADLCEAAGADVEEVPPEWALIAASARPSCAPVPATAAPAFRGMRRHVATAGLNGVKLNVISSAVATNATRKNAMARRVFALWEPRRRQWSRCLASRSRPTPMTCAKRRPSPSSMA